MQNLLFFSRVALICNICFLITALLRFLPLLTNGAVTSLLIITGSVLSMLVNTLLMFLYVVLLITRRSIKNQVPAWLLITNILVFVLQIIFLIK